MWGKYKPMASCISMYGQVKTSLQTTMGLRIR
jgi:hypothetical protein